MTDLSIQFRAPMILALLAGRKTQTRRLAWRVIEGNDLMKPPGSPLSGKGFRGDDLISADIDGTFGFRATKWQKVQPGDRLWAKETHYVWDAGYKDGSGKKISYPATEPDTPTTWTSPIHMPKLASRITLIVTAVRFELLQDINWHDAEAEGIFTGDPVEEYRLLWESINGLASWDANPEVVVISFDVVKENIDDLKSGGK